MTSKRLFLRAMIAGLFCVVVFASCHHSGSSDGGSPVNNSYLALASTVSQGSMINDSFSYDDQHRIARFVQYATDGTHSGVITIDFTFSGGNALPAGYTYTMNTDAPKSHVLAYDGQGRIIKDTSLSGDHFVTYYTYSGNYIINTILFDGTYNDAQIDSLKVTDGNITGTKVWGADQGTWEKQGDVTLAHVTAANPGYKEPVANAIGPLLYVLSVYNYGGYNDFISKALTNKISGEADGLPPGGFNYSVSVDASARVSSMSLTGVGVPAGSKTVFTYY